MFASKTSFSRHRRQMSDYFRCMPEAELLREGFKKREDGIIFLPKNRILKYQNTIMIRLKKAR